MPSNIFTYRAVPDGLLQLVTSHLPFSLPLLRRLQYTSFKHGLTPTSRIILVSDTGEIGDELPPPTRFTVAYVDVGSDHNTQMWLYSTLEDQKELSADDDLFYEQQLRGLVDEIIFIDKEYGGKLAHSNAVLIGTLNSSVRAILERTGRVIGRKSGIYDKWLFRVEDVPENHSPLPDGMHWATATLDDCKVAISRSDIPRTAESLSLLPSSMIKLEDGTPIAWAFLSPDGSLASLHCEEPYRRRGLAKTLAAKLFRERTYDYGNDGWCSADVSPDNDGSRGMCMRLNGKPYWTLSWVLLVVRAAVEGETEGRR
ncbi:hypothetical protein BGZ61DRAFT_461450 [Ilyonectria robusta]|uniref:uncharacterized protein n=1 Tax=Ilyonectria robusta TaxID=1079257 RepID=UPI001E8EB0FF|nr:uncharacterized protein BGZ61DRAFT_461450 [Ilyonectria robusta]KAH8667264.1 hypothetical protein BGZ61DRAFT_461450 [Ilyonectria robusta]